MPGKFSGCHSSVSFHHFSQLLQFGRGELGGSACALAGPDAGSAKSEEPCPPADGCLGIGDRSKARAEMLDHPWQGTANADKKLDSCSLLEMRIIQSGLRNECTK